MKVFAAKAVHTLNKDHTYYNEEEADKLYIFKDTYRFDEGYSIDFIHDYIKNDILSIIAYDGSVTMKNLDIKRRI